MKALAFILVLVIANFFYQWWQLEPAWMVALERSYFQTLAIAVYAYLWP